jgi:phosphate starvation-inducible PhoH-like protein
LNKSALKQKIRRNDRKRASKSPGATLTFEDNELLKELFGAHDQNLALIEDKLDVVAYPRGNQIALTGTASACRSAEHVLKALYQKLVAGQHIAPGDVEGAIRLEAPSSRTGNKEPIDGLSFVTKRRVVSPRSKGQAEYMKALMDNELVFGTGPAGTGKTYLAVAAAVVALVNGTVDKIILSRPAVEAGERLGFLPGDMRDKVDPYLQPLYDALYDLLPGNQVARGLEDGTIQIAPLAFMRGRTLAHAFVILDEAQNCTNVQMKMFLTRLGDNSRMVVTGDPSQVDLPKGVPSGLSEAVNLLKKVKSVAHTSFKDEDVVRHPLVARIVKAYDKQG